MMISLPEISRLARERLPADLADRYCSLLRPSGQILSAAQPGDEQVGFLGGEPKLPETSDWPMWEGHGPLSFVAALDCGPLSTTQTGALPASGTLLFFYFDGQADNYQSWVHPSEPESQPGSRVLNIPAGTPVQPCRTPSPLEPYKQVPLRAEPAVALPLIETFEMYEPLCIAPETLDTDPMYAEFNDAVRDLCFTHKHQIGGLPGNVQGEVEYEVADFSPEWDVDDFTPDNPHLDDILAEASRWELLAQFAGDDDAGMMWGDAGVLYWLATAQDLAAQRFDKARFTWQCH
ncbi:YwqG family protein [Actinomadura sp. B10D3]|uniref:YwqG family protein n=1 Tax=Actinomadura sp. B10D3 TaxID=3153557 RepID=UPI00325E926B